MSDMPDLPEIRKLDFSRAHFLDHSIWTCGSSPERQTGGRRRHIAYAWDILWRPQLLYAVPRRPSQASQGLGRSWITCEGVHRLRELREDP